MNNKQQNRKFNKTKFKGSSTRNKSEDSMKKEDLTSSVNSAGIPEHNDYSWYAPNEQIAKDLASLPFNYVGGTPFKISLQRKTSSTGILGKESALRSMFTLDYVNSIGVGDSTTTGINMAATQLYTFIRHANSGARNYEAADVMMYILANRDIYSSFFECKRAIGIASLFEYFNHNLPDLVLRALRIDPVDLRANLAGYRARLNIIAQKMNSFAVPKYFKCFDRTAYISSYIFSDSSSVRGQFYAFQRKGYYTWSGTASETGTSLVYNPYDGFVFGYPTSGANGYTTLANRLDVLEAQLDALFLDEDALTMSGDILKAFNAAELYKVASTDENYQVKFLFDENILGQIENAFIPGIPGKDKEFIDFNITQDNQLITFEPKLKYASNGNIIVPTTGLAFNSHKDSPDYKDVLEWSRLMSNWSYSVDSDNKVTATLLSAGLEIITGGKVWHYSSDNMTVDGLSSHDIASCGRINTTDTNLVNYFDSLANLQQFDWHPICYLLDGSDATNIVGDLKVTTVMPFTTLDEMNKASVFSCFYGNLYLNNTSR